MVGTAPRIASVLRGALERAAICSNDPVCADHEPDDRSGDRATHGAACHEVPDWLFCCQCQRDRGAERFAPQDDAIGGIARDGKGVGCRGVSPVSVGRPLEPP
jgi:hypothetical protein